MPVLTERIFDKFEIHCRVSLAGYVFFLYALIFSNLTFFLLFNSLLLNYCWFGFLISFKQDFRIIMDPLLSNWFKQIEHAKFHPICFLHSHNALLSII